jgi:Flp pilus assembly pilin Flp
MYLSCGTQRLKFGRKPRFATGCTELEGQMEQHVLMLWKEHVLPLWKEEEGQDLTEYALLLVLIALTAVAVMSSLGSAVGQVFSKGASSLNSATT